MVYCEIWASLRLGEKWVRFLTGSFIWAAVHIACAVACKTPSSVKALLWKKCAYLPLHLK